MHEQPVQTAIVRENSNEIIRALKQHLDDSFQQVNQGLKIWHECGGTADVEVEKTEGEPDRISARLKWGEG